MTSVNLDCKNIHLLLFLLERSKMSLFISHILKLYTQHYLLQLQHFIAYFNVEYTPPLDNPIVMYVYLVVRTLDFDAHAPNILSATVCHTSSLPPHHCIRNCAPLPLIHCFSATLAIRYRLSIRHFGGCTTAPYVPQGLLPDIKKEWYCIFKTKNNNLLLLLI